MPTTLLVVTVAGGSADNSKIPTFVRNGNTVDAIIQDDEKEDIAEEVKSVNEDDEQLKDAGKTSYDYHKENPKHD